MDDFKHRFIKFRESQNLSQAKLVERLRKFGENDITAGNISHWETGRFKPSSDKLLAIQKTFPNLNIDWLLSGNGEMIIKPTLSSTIPVADPSDMNAALTKEHIKLLEEYETLKKLAKTQDELLEFYRNQKK